MANFKPPTSDDTEIRLSGRHKISPCFYPFGVRISKNPLLSGIYVMKQLCCPNFRFLGATVWSGR